MHRRLCPKLAVSLLTWLSLAAHPTVVHAQADFSVSTSEYTSWDNDNWVLTTNRLIQGQYQSRAPVANGYIGCGIAAAGPFFEADINQTDPSNGKLPVNGWPLDNPRQTFCTVSGFFNTQANTTRTNFPENLLRGGESVIAGIPNWPNLQLEVGSAVLNASVDNKTISNFQSSRSLKNGLLSWTYDWSPTAAINISIKYDLVADRSNPNVAVVRLTAKAQSDVNATLVDVLDGRGAVRSVPGERGSVSGSNTIFTSVSPNWLPNVTAWIYSTVQGDSLGSRSNFSATSYSATSDSTYGQRFPISLSAGQQTVFTKYVGIASSDGFDDPRSVAINASMDAVKAGFDTVQTRSAAAWAVLMDDDLVDDYSLPDGSLPTDENVRNIHIVSKANAHYLLQNFVPSNYSSLAKWSISVGGLGSDSYAGMIFWDADIFMAPGVSVTHPQYSYQIPNYRAQLSRQAYANGHDYGYADGSILYPWTSGRWGNCTGTGPCVDYQYHLNSDIFLNNLVYWRITGDDSWFNETAVPINDGILRTFSQLVYYNDTLKAYSIRNLTDPDEYANQVPDGALTLASIAKIIELAEEYGAEFDLTFPSNYSTIAENLALPFAPSGLLTEYRGANNTAVIKQDDVDLINYPFDYSSANYTRADKLTSLDYYANLQSPDGPAMTYSFYAISANALSPSGCSAYTYALQGFLPYARAPWYQFSEQQVDDFDKNGGTNPAFPFMTGAGGWHQVGPMGWLGVRVVEDQLLLYPSLPPQISHVSVRTVIYGGAGLKATMNQTHTNLTRVDASRYLPANSTDKYQGQAMPFTVGFSLEDGQNRSISLGQTLTIENRRYSDKHTAAGNLLQCLPVASSGATSPGQFALAAIDGASSTRWQPANSNASSLTIDTRGVQYQAVSGISLDWGARPPQTARVSIFNGTNVNENTTVVTASFTNITISQPYNATTEAIIKPYVGNQSFFSFNAPVYSGQYITLTIEGCLEDDGDAATVGEFNLYGASGNSLLDGAKNGSVTVVSPHTNQTSPVSVGTVTPSTTQGSPTVVATQGLPGQTGAGGGGQGTGTTSTPPASTGAASPSLGVSRGLIVFLAAVVVSAVQL